jgi:hypothetical protein
VSGFDARVTAFSFRRQRLDGSAGDALDAVRAVVGVYSAMPGGALSIRVRAAGIGPDDVRDLERGRLVVRMRAMRTSAFIVPLTTAGRVAAATAVPLARFRWLVRAAGISDEGVPAVRAAVLAASGEPGTVPEIRVRLADAGHDAATSPWTQGEALGRVLSLLTASGDVAAIGQESLSSNALRYVDRAAWFGEIGPGEPVVEPDAADSEAARGWLAGEYLRAFGPARIEDLAWWAGWPRSIAARAIGTLDTVDLGAGLRLLAADFAAFESAEPLPAVITLLPKWDAWTMGYPLEGRDRFVDMDVHDRVFDGDGNGLAMILRGGRAIGAWAHRGERGSMAVDLDLFQGVAPTDHQAIDTELASIATFLRYRGHRVRTVETVVPARRRMRRPLEPRSGGAASRSGEREGGSDA